MEKARLPLLPRRRGRRLASAGCRKQAAFLGIGRGNWPRRRTRKRTRTIRRLVRLREQTSHSVYFAILLAMDGGFGKMRYVQIYLMKSRWIWFWLCALLGVVVLACGWIIPAYVRAVD